MKRLIAVLIVSTVAAPPVAADSPAPSASREAREPVSFLAVVETDAASGVWRAQNTPTITTGLIRDDDRKRSALAFAISGAGAFVGAALWRWLPCRNAKDGSTIGTLQIEGYNKCYDQDGNRLGFDTPTKLLLGAGVVLEVVSLGYLIAHLRGQNDDPDPQPQP